MSDSTVNGGISPESFSFSTEENQANAALLLRQIGNVAGATTIVDDDAHVALTSERDRLYFISGVTSVGGAMSIAGGTNALVGGELGGHGWHAGDWNVRAMGRQTGARFASGADTFNGGGADTFHGGGADTVFAGGANVLITVADTSRLGTVIDPASGLATFLGGQSDGAHILAGGTGGGFYQLGTGADSVVGALANDGKDQLPGWHAVRDRQNWDTSAAATLQDRSAGLHATLSDGTRITIAGLHDQSAIQIVFGKPGS